MKLIHGLHNLEKQQGSVVTIGNFDGVHAGHEKIILRLIKKSKALGAPSVLISFMPTPQSFFNHPQASLSSFKEKHNLLSKLGLDIHLIIRFNQAFSQLKAQDFVQTVLLDKLAMKHCLVGDDFCFGKDRVGDFELLKTLSKTNSFTVEKTPSILCDNHRVSSSKIRSLLEQGEMQSASQMLGREFSIVGKVIHGFKNGRNIGFPTINIPIKRKISPVHGIFAVTAELDGNIHQGVCSIGNRPIIGGEKTLLEVFLFDFDEQVYGFEVKTVFKHKIRDERDFEDFEALKQQIKIDVEDAKNYFKNQSNV
ncbi:MAG: Bifunctional riboflavin kinase/FMN adenylyltransferase [Catillopecten margaritatus gill symbiont]|uniref:Riboflavin biosynthesis protein n=1 Tax=Catillopecten margaritatus gill symbiont TaxID=3083288 RepID=A0AAU6PHS7_9GAMM